MKSVFGWCCGLLVRRVFFFFFFHGGREVSKLSMAAYPGVSALFSYKDASVIRQRAQSLVEGRVDLLAGALEELAASAVEESIAREDDPVIAVPYVPADAVLRVARRVQPRHGNASQLEALAVRRGRGDGLAILASVYRQGWQAEIAPLGNGRKKGPVSDVRSLEDR